MARRYRPETFAEVIAQSHITETLQRAIESERVASAYLFTGPRGSGKTTVARILAKALNCERPKNGAPCATCDTCKGIREGRSLDVLEIDGASNNSVDDVRELRENVRYAASAPGRRKVYIIDEVHMLSTGAFNALLKTLEEPPSHVLFVFATTEPRKVPQTILSRCQRFDFRRLRSDEIHARLQGICKKEKLEIEDAALHLLAKRADGSLRDGLSLLDQVASSTNGKIREAQVAEVLGLVREEVYLDLGEAFLAHDSVRALELLHAAQHEGADPAGFVLGLVEHLRNLMLLSVDPSLRRAVQLGDTHLQRAEALAQRFRTEDLLFLLNRAATLHEEIRNSSQPMVVLEASMVELARFESRVLLSEVLEKLGGPTPAPPAGRTAAGGANPKSGTSARGGTAGGGSSLFTATSPAVPGPKPASGAFAPGGSPPAAGGPFTPPRAPQGRAQQPQAATMVASGFDLAQVRDRWAEFTRTVADSKAMLAQCLAEGMPSRLEGARLHVEFTEEQRFHLEMLQQPGPRAELEQLLGGYFGQPLQLVPCASATEDAGAARLTHEDIVQSRRDALHDVAERFPRVQEILDAFDGEILEDHGP